MNFLIPITLLTVIVTILYLYIKRVYNYWDRKGFPNIKPSIPYGNIDKNEPIISFNLQKLYQKLKNKGPIGGIYLFHTPIGLITDLELVKQILIKDFSTFQERGLYFNEKDDPLSASVLTIGGDRWRRLRQKLSPTFTSGKMKYMFPLVADVGKELDGVLSDYIAERGNQSVDIEIRELAARFTTDVIGSCAFGIECNSLRNPASEFRRMGQRGVEVQKFSATMALVISANQKLCNWLGVTLTMPDVAKFFTDIVRQTIDYRKSSNVKRSDFMNILLELKDNEALSFNEIAAQVFLFFLGGFETSATTLSFIMHELMVHPDIQERARNEIETVLAKYNGNLTYEAMLEMTYVDQVINETLRMHPVFPAIGRIVTKDYNIPNTKLILPQGSSILIPIHAFHYDPEIYPNPDKFDPERFSPEQINDRSSVAFLSFGDGPRNCIGLRFAMMQVRVGLISFLSGYKFSPSKKSIIPIELRQETFILDPKHGVWMTVEKIKDKQS